MHSCTSIYNTRSTQLSQACELIRNITDVLGMGGCWPIQVILTSLFYGLCVIICRPLETGAVNKNICTRNAITCERTVRAQ